MIVYVVYDDYNAYLGNGAPLGIYSTRAKAVDAIREMPSRVLPLDIAEFEVDKDIEIISEK